MIGRKEFAAIAAVLAQVAPALSLDDADSLNWMMAQALAKLNPRFDRERFLAACRKPPYG